MMVQLWKMYFLSRAAEEHQRATIIIIIIVDDGVVVGVISSFAFKTFCEDLVFRLERGSRMCGCARVWKRVRVCVCAIVGVRARCGLCVPISLGASQSQSTVNRHTGPSQRRPLRIHFEFVCSRCVQSVLVAIVASSPQVLVLFGTVVDSSTTLLPRAYPSHSTPHSYWWKWTENCECAWLSEAQNPRVSRNLHIFKGQSRLSEYI